MKYVRKIAVILLITLITICAVFISYTGIKNGAVVYATNQDGTLTNDELDVAMSSWLESHGGNIFSPQNYRARKTYEAGLLHNFKYGDGGGYDAIRQHINGVVGGNNELKFDFDEFILQKLNTWLNRELQKGTFGQGAELNENGMFDDGIDNSLYSGELFVDDNGNACFVTVYTYYGNYDYNRVTKMGTKFIKDGGIDAYNYFVSKGSPQSAFINYTDFTVNGTTYHHTIIKCSGSSYNISLTYNNRCYYYYEWGSNKYSGFPTIAREQDSSNLYTAVAMYNPYYRDNICVTNDRIQNKTAESVNINFYTNNNNNVNIYPTIVDADGHLYITPKVNVGVNGEVNYQPYIINEGDTINNVINQYYIDSNTPDKTISYPSDNPDDNGSGGGGNDNPSGGTPPNWSNPYPSLNPDGNGGFNFNFTLPDLNIDWNISGLTEKFPFSIPFDFLAFCRVLNAEPQVPEWSGTLVLPMYSHQFTFSLQQFNSVAVILRNLEFIGFCIGLILATRSLIKG